MKSIDDLPAIPKLPDPFQFQNGSKVLSKQDWVTRRQEIRQLVETHLYGPLPPPPTSLEATWQEPQLTITCHHAQASINFQVTITYPTHGVAPYPAIIAIGRRTTLPKDLLDELGIAIISFPNDELAKQGGAKDRGLGKFYDLHGSDHPAGSLMAWAWGVGRLIDALQKTSDAKIDPTRLAVTGCSRNGKGALVCGAMDERIALTIPTESGAGGASSWRVADAILASGGNVQTARQIVQENTWLSPSFVPFGPKIERLPIDQHLVIGLCAPRPILITENTAMEWLGPSACFTTARAAQTIWDALDAKDHFGFVQTSHPDHCVFKEKDELKRFLQRFLLHQPVETDIFSTDGSFQDAATPWITWTTPDWP